MTRINGRNTDGTFGKGNPGRPKGARNRSSILISQLLDGEAENIGRKAIELALSGDTVAMRLCLERISPPIKERVFEIDLPKLDSLQAASNFGEEVIRRVCCGDITPAEGDAMMKLVERYIDAFTLKAVEQRLDEIEKRFSEIAVAEQDI